MKLSMAEILSRAGDLPTREEKIKYLQKHYSPALGIVLKAAYDKDIIWDLPSGKPPYKPMPPGTDLEGVLYHQAKRLGKFIKGGEYPHADSTKRQLWFIQLLESCDPRDAELLIHVKNKTLPYKGITPGLLNKAFPGLINV